MKAPAITCFLLSMGLTAIGQNHILDINTRKPGAAIQPTMWGLFFEDINYAADGGLYGELIKNRSFEFPDHLMGWEAFGTFEIKSDGPFPRCPHYVELSYPGHEHRHSGLSNNGYFGIGVNQDEEYRFSLWAKAPKGKARIAIQLIERNTMESAQEFVTTKLDITSSDWKKYEVTMKSSRTVNKAQLRIFLEGKESVCLEHISLFPVHTFRDRPNGMRRDLAQALADAQPGLLRFPGGCIVEGVDLDTRYQWKNTIGPVENRPLNENRWEYTFRNRFFPDYFQSGGLGFYEFFQLAEDIGAEPLPVMNVGMACQFQNPDNEKAHATADQLQAYIQDCLDLIEFANGAANSEWGQIRAQMGHPEPFNLKFIAVGNEQWDEMYFHRLEPFIKAIHARYPNIKIVGSSGPNPDGEKFEKGWDEMKRQKADLVDEHYYRNEEWFLSHGLRYDNYDRKGPKVFAGEYACHVKGNSTNHYRAAIMEAALMTGLERNADVVHMSAYAPLLAHYEGWQWRPDLIWFDNLQVVKTCSYYVQQMYAGNRGSNVLPLTMDNKVVAGQSQQDGLFASSALDRSAGLVIVKVVNTSKFKQAVTLNLLGIKGERTAETLTLSHEDLEDENTIDRPDKIFPKPGCLQSEQSKKECVFHDELPSMSFRLYKIMIKK